MKWICQVEVKDGGNLEEEEEAAGGCTLTRLIFPDLATTVVSLLNHRNHRNHHADTELNTTLTNIVVRSANKSSSESTQKK